MMDEQEEEGQIEEREQHEQEIGGALLPAPAADLSCRTAIEGETDSAIQIAERVRVQELLRDEGIQQGEVSPDRTLTALAQLAALKFDCQRSFISLVDYKYQYIIAEATRSISLESEKIRDDDDDALLTGATALDLVWGMCAATMKVFTVTDGRHNVLTRYLKADKESFVIHDMSKLDAYKDRPYVSGWPFMRFYAEVPISSPNGLAIGSICVVDNAPRPEFTAKNIATLKEIADTVVDHLDLVMSRIQRKRAQRMIKGLGIFAVARNGNSSSSVHEGIDEDMRRLTVKDPNHQGSTTSLQSPENIPSLSPGRSEDYILHSSSSSSSEPAADLLVGSSDLGSQNTRTSSNDVEKLFGSDPGQRSDKSKSPHEQEPLVRRDSSSTDNDDKQNENVQPTVFDQMLLQAADLIRGAVNLDRVVFFDQQYRSNHGVLSSNTGGNEYTREDIAEIALQEPHSIAKVLVESPQDRCSTSSPVEVNLLTTVVKHLPRGGILRFDSDGTFVEYAEFDLSLDSFRNKIVSENNVGSDFEVADLARELNKTFECRLMILFPLWAATGDDLFAYAIGATSEQDRIFQREDFAYITSFGNLLTGELSRLEVLSADHAKSVFISSISHELRSPLHGILASAELLKDSVTDKTGLDIVKTIESCGSTLLDTFDNLLSFAKINYFTVAQNQPNSNKSHEISGDVKSLSSVFDLSILLEEVMNSSLAGHHFRTSVEKESAHGSHQNEHRLGSQNDILHIICDIQDADWIVSTQAGAWTRIIMNLFGNAMKYTPSGFIRVALNIKQSVRSLSGDEESEIILSVEDSGQGISEAFLANNLYKPFHQENVLRPGTGLGLSIVKQLVHSINGTVTVESKVNYGTIFTITAKVLRPKTNGHPETVPALRIEALPELYGLRLGILGFDLPTQPDGSTLDIENLLRRRNEATQASLYATLDRLGLVSTIVTSIGSQDIDIFLTTEEHYLTTDQDLRLALRNPVIILNSSLSVDYRDRPENSGPLIYLSQPFGRTRLIKALKSCLDFRNSPAVELEPTRDTKLIEMVPLDTQANELVVEKTEVLPLVNIKTNSIVSEDTCRSRPRILLVEDNVINLKLLVAFVRKLKCPFETATDGQEAVDAYRANAGDFDAIFMDIQMPNKDGIAASSEIRAYERDMSLKRTLIIAITGLASREAHQQAAQSGVDSLLTKPVSLKSLKGIVDGLPEG